MIILLSAILAEGQHGASSPKTTCKITLSKNWCCRMFIRCGKSICLDSCGTAVGGDTRGHGYVGGLRGRSRTSRSFDKLHAAAQYEQKRKLVAAAARAFGGVTVSADGLRWLGSPDAKPKADAKKAAAPKAKVATKVRKPRTTSKRAIAKKSQKSAKARGRG